MNTNNCVALDFETATASRGSVYEIGIYRWTASINRWISSSPSMNERFEIRSVWSTKRNYGSQTAAVFVSPREIGPLRSPTSLSPLHPPGGRGKGFPRRASPSPFGRPAASEVRQVLVQVQVMDPCKHFGPFLLVQVQTMDLYGHCESSESWIFGGLDILGDGSRVISWYSYLCKDYHWYV